MRKGRDATLVFLRWELLSCKVKICLISGEDFSCRLNGIDPIGGCIREPVEAVPPVDPSDLVSYLVLQTDFITTKQFKAHKSLEAYNQFVCGWIKDVCIWRVSRKCVTTSVFCFVKNPILVIRSTLQGRHSQQMNDSPLSCWIIVTETTGEVQNAHCNCMTGSVGERCTHVAAVLFYLEVAAKIQGKQTSMQHKCEWIMPSFKKNVHIFSN